jgi:hypothetical protein
MLYLYSPKLSKPPASSPSWKCTISSAGNALFSIFIVILFIWEPSPSTSWDDMPCCGGTGPASFYHFLDGVVSSPLLLRPLLLLYQPWTMMDDDECGVLGGMLGRGNWSKRRKPVPRAALSTTNPTRPHARSNPGHRCGKRASNLLSYGTALTGPG